jgi:hypothetical protein
MKEASVQTETKDTGVDRAAATINEALGNRGLDGEEIKRLQELRDKGVSKHKKLTKEEKTELAALEAVDSAERKRRALVHKLVSGADAYGRKCVTSITRRITDRVKALKEEETVLVSDLSKAHKKAKTEAEKRMKKAMQRVQEEHNKTIKGLEDDYAREVASIRKRFGEDYAAAQLQLSDDIDASVEHVAAFAKDVAELEIDQLEKLQKEGVLQVERVGGTCTFLTVPGQES